MTIGLILMGSGLALIIIAKIAGMRSTMRLGKRLRKEEEEK